MWMQSSASLIQGMCRYQLENIHYCSITIICSRENTVLRGQLFERSEENTLLVRQNLYVIPNALVAEQFKPCLQTSTDTSKV
jgi:phosphatidylinositol glycan class A protein